MNLMAHFTFSSADINEIVFGHLWELFPEFRMDHPMQRALNVHVPISDPRFSISQEILEQAGYKARNNTFREKMPKEYDLDIERVYGPVDWEGAELLRPAPFECFLEYDTDSHGLVVVEDKYMNRMAIQEDIAFDPMGPRLFVSSPLREVLEAEQFGHLEFRRTLLKDYDTGEILSWPDHIGERWALTTDLKLPPADWSNMVNGKGEPYTGDPAGGCEISEGPYRSVELHYRRETLRNFPRFGLALTSEIFGRTNGERIMIASKEFYQACTKRSIRMGWIPVRIDG